MAVQFFPFSAFVPDGGGYGRQLDRAKNVLPIHGGYRSLRKKANVAAVADGPMTGAFVHIYQQSLAEQIARPDADTTLGIWNPNTGTTLWTQIDEETPSDGDYIFAGGSPLNEVCKIRLADILTPSGGAHTLRWRYAATGYSAAAAAAVTSITRASQTATVTTTAPHGLASNDWALMAGATQPEYNGVFQITVTGASTFTYTVTGTPATPATGTITWRRAWAVKLELVEGSTVRSTDYVGGVADVTFTQRSTSITPAVGDYTNLFFQLTATVPSTVLTYVRPVSDDTVGGWTTSAGGGTNLYATVDEAVIDDADYAQSPALSAGQSAAYTLNLGTSAQLWVDKTHNVRYRYFAANAGMSLAVTLLQGTTTIASWSHSGITAATWTTATQALSSGERAAIKAGGGYTGLKLKFEASYPTSVTPTAWQEVGPISDQANAFPTEWETDTGSKTNLFAAVDESSANDADYITGAASTLPGSTYCELVLGTATDPLDDKSYIVKMRGRSVPGSGDQVIITFKRNDGTTIRTWDLGAGTPGVGPLTGNFVTYSFTLSDGEGALVSPHSGLYYALTGYSGSGGNGSGVQVSWLRLLVPELRRIRVSFAELELPSPARLDVSWAEYRTPTADTRYRGDLPTRFCGSRKNLYTFDTPGFTDVSVGGPSAPGAGPYGAGGSIPGGWYFAPWGNHIIATNFTDLVQWRQNNTGQFANMITGTDKPKARFVCAARDHVMLGSINFAGHEVDEVWWSAFQNSQSFDVSVATQCDKRRLYMTAGQLMGLVGGDTPLVFKRRSVIAMQWVGGKLVWQPVVVSRSVGTPFPKSIVTGQDKTLWWGGDCFYSLVEGGQPVALGRGVISRFLTDSEFSDGAIKQIDPTEMRIEDQIMEGHFDPSCGLFIWHYEGVNDSDWQHNRCVVYDPSSDRWAIPDLSAYFEGDVGYPPARIAALTQLPNTTTSATNDLKGSIGIDWDGVNSTWFRFDGSTTYAAQFRSKVFAIQLDDAERPLMAEVVGILPVFSSVLKAGGSWPPVTITLEMALDPRMVLAYNSEAYTSPTHTDQRQMFPFQLGGLWARITVDVGSMSAAMMNAFEGVYIEWNQRGTGGA